MLIVRKDLKRTKKVLHKLWYLSPVDCSSACYKKKININKSLHTDTVLVAKNKERSRWIKIM